MCIFCTFRVCFTRTELQPHFVPNIAQLLQLNVCYDSTNVPKEVQQIWAWGLFPDSELSAMIANNNSNHHTELGDQTTCGADISCSKYLLPAAMVNRKSGCDFDLKLSSLRRYKIFLWNRMWQKALTFENWTPFAAAVVCINMGVFFSSHCLHKPKCGQTVPKQREMLLWRQSSLRCASPFVRSLWIRRL